MFGLTPGQTYYARVRAINFEGESVSPTATVNSGAEAVPAAPD